MNKTSTICVDLDGTIANADHRLPYILDLAPGQKKNWVEFFGRVKEDPPYKELIQDIITGVNLLDLDLVFLTGRPERFKDINVRQDTISWLTDQGIIPSMYTLLMRPDKDTRPDYIVKPEVLLKSGISLESIVGVFEDRPKVIEAMRNLGLMVYECKDGKIVEG